MSSIADRECELAKHESELDLLESEYLADADRFKVECLRELAQKLTSQVRLISRRHCDGDGLLDHLISLRDLSTHVVSLDPNSTDTCVVMSARDRLLSLKHRLEKLITGRDFIAMIDLNVILGEISEIESIINRLIERRSEIDNLIASYRMQSERVNDGLCEIELLLGVRSDDLNHDEDSVELEIRASRLKSARVNLTTGQLKIEFDRLHEFAKRLDDARVTLDSHSYERHRIRYYDLVVRLDKYIKGAESGLGDLKRITDKSQMLLELIKNSHSILASVCLRRGGSGVVSADKCEFLNFSSVGIETDSGGQHHHQDSSRTINEWIDLLRTKVMCRLNQHEPIKAEILRLYARFLKSSRNKRKFRTILSGFDNF